MIGRPFSDNRRLPGRAVLRRKMLGALFLFAALVFGQPDPLPAAGDPKPGMIVSPALNLRSGPGLHHPSIAKLHRGDKVLVLSYEGEWVRILFGEQTGFVMNRSTFLRIDESGSEPGGTIKNPQTRTEKAAVNRKIQVSSKQIASISEKEADIINDLEKTERALDKARKQVNRLTKELAATNEQITELENRQNDIQARAAAMEQYVAGRLAALYKLSWLGKVQVLASADSMFEFFSCKNSLERILAHDEAVMAELANDRIEIKALLSQLDAKRHEKQATASALNVRINALNREQSHRSMLLSQIRNKKSLQLAMIDSLKTSAHELSRTVESFGKAPAKQSTAAMPVAEKPFTALKGLLMMPVKGKIVSFFGPIKDQEFRVTHFESGITIKADRGEPIRAVYNGKTLFAAWFKGFGNMMIIDHGGHYYTVYAHVEEFFKSKGDPVETGEVIATVGDTGSLTGTGLHFEVRHHGKPINPMEWINNG